MTTLYLVVALTLLISFLCSLAEAALYSVPASHIEALRRRGRASGRLLTELRGQIDRPIAAILSLNTMANTGGAVMAGAVAAVAFGDQWLGLFSAAFTLVLLVVGEVIPKTIGVVHARTVSALMARPLRGLVVLLTPLIWVTRVVTRLVLPGSHEQRVSDEDVLVLVRLGLRSGAFQSHEAAVIENVLALETTTVGEVLTPRPVVFALPASLTVTEASRRDEIRNYSRIPVYDRDKDYLIGIVQRTDVLLATADGRAHAALADLMRPLEFVVETTPLDRLLRWFIARREHLVAVTDEFGGLAGIATLEDILEELLGQEIVGEQDAAADLRAVAQGRLRRRQGQTPRPSG